MRVFHLHMHVSVHAQLFVALLSIDAEFVLCRQS